jgi:hypothetical protein
MNSASSPVSTTVSLKVDSMADSGAPGVDTAILDILGFVDAAPGRSMLGTTHPVGEPAFLALSH